jgi:hypothetical protein
MGRKSKESAGSRFRRKFDERYTANPAEDVLREHAAELADLGERLAAEIKKQPLTGHGAAGQEIANPLHRDFIEVTARFSAIVDALALPDRPVGKLSTTARAQRAAQRRWANRGAAS